MELDARTLRRLQLVELDLLRELDRICRAEKIGYVVIAGTMLGAVRHGGFIPWDDDADVAMPRADYERFREACASRLDHERYCFQDQLATPGYRWGYGKLRRRDTLFVREHQEHMPYEQGVFIDVFPIDAVPASWPGRALKNAECFCVRKVLWAPVGMHVARNPLARLVFRALARIPEDRVKAYCANMVRRAGRTRSDWARVLMFPTPNRQYGYLRRWYEDGVEVSFEGVRLLGVADADGYLSFKFGDYTRLPPASQRKTHPVSSIDVGVADAIK